MGHIKPKAITVCVEYEDLLEISLPRNLRHVSRCIVVTSPQDAATQRLVDSIDGAELFVTDAFYRDGAVFNKWLALEDGLDRLGRDGWLLLWDADTIFPSEMDLSGVDPGFLYTPRRHILHDLRAWSDSLDWSTVPLKNEGEWAGYFQLFHAEDPHLPSPPPWHQVDFTHAGTADSLFQDMWQRNPYLNKPECRRRLPFNVMHLGDPGQNWCGRASVRMDGTISDLAEDRRQKLREYLAGRGTGQHRFDNERLRKNEQN